jgi:hypothetical protein
MRPDKIYLEEPIRINDVEVRHTPQGLEYLINHYKHILANATPKQLGDKERQHIIEWLIPNLKYHLTLYKNQNLNQSNYGNTENRNPEGSHD